MWLNAAVLFAITVKRTGDVSAASSVDYLTDDGSVASAAVPCSLVTGFALERCDYTRASGTLQFAANETEKSFVVLVNDDSYAEGTEITSLKLSNPGAGATPRAQAAATLQITDDMPESVDNPVDDGGPFVRQHYHDFLNREPDAEGFKFWTNNLAECGTDGCGEEEARGYFGGLLSLDRVSGNGLPGSALLQDGLRRR